jgi:hypothetical protein
VGEQQGSLGAVDAAGPAGAGRQNLHRGVGSLRVSDVRIELLGDPLVEQADVVLAGHQHPAGGVRPRVGREPAPPGGGEALLATWVDSMGVDAT